ncbi:MAG: uncharacterized protein JWO63_2905 [Frankiales bacterium]|nr:uncharacterized protein [Frankiales bacterium]
MLGFFLIAMLFVAGATAVSGAFTDQRDLQSICDGASLAAANSASGQALHGGGNDRGAIELSGAEDAVASYLARAGIADVRTSGGLSADGMTVQVTCVRHTRVAFGSFIGRGGGIDQRAVSSARSPLG